MTGSILLYMYSFYKKNKKSGGKKKCDALDHFKQWGMPRFPHIPHTISLDAWDLDEGFEDNE